MTRMRARLMEIRGARAVVGVILAVVLGAAPLRAQETTFFAGIGAGESWRDESRKGPGIRLFAGAELQLFRGVGLLAELSRSSHSRHFAFGGRWQGSDMIASGSVVGRFGERRVRPYLLAGLSFVRSELLTEWPVFDPELSPSPGGPVVALVDTERVHTSDIAFGASFGGGIDVELHPRILARTEARFYSALSLELALTGSLGLTYRW